MEFRRLGRSGLNVSEISYGNWITHGSQVEEDAAHACVRAALDVPFIANQPQYSMLWRVIESKVIPASKNAGIGQIVWSPIAQGILTGKYLPGQPPPAGSRATDPQGSQFLGRRMTDELLAAV